MFVYRLGRERGCLILAHIQVNIVNIGAAMNRLALVKILRVIKSSDGQNDEAIDGFTDRKT